MTLGLQQMNEMIIFYKILRFLIEKESNNKIKTILNLSDYLE
jgi:hypothetical protein